MNDGSPAPEGEIGISPITGADTNLKQRSRFSFPRRRARPQIVSRSEIDDFTLYTKPTLKLLSTCTQEGIFLVATNNKLQTAVGGTDRFRALVTELAPKMLKAKEHLDASLSMLEVPKDFQWEQEWKGAFPVVRELLGSEAQRTIPGGVLSRAMSFASEENARFVEANKEGLFDQDRYVTKVLGKKLPRDGKQLPQVRPPQNAQERNAIALTVGKEPIMRLALEFQEIADAIGSPMSTDTALRLATVKIAGNEFGHAVDSALASDGVQTYYRALPSLKRDRVTSGDITLPLIGAGIHRELFARGIDTIVVGEYLVKKLGYTASQVEQFFTREREVGAVAVAETRQILAENPSTAGRVQLVRNQHAIGKLLGVLYPQYQRDMTPHIEYALKYRAAPYPREMIAQLAANPR